MSRGRPQKYPWQEWLNGQEHEIIIGKDIECSLTTFRANLWKHAQRAKVRTITRCETRKTGRKTESVLTIKAFPLKVEKHEKRKTKRKPIRSS